MPYIEVPGQGMVYVDRVAGQDSPTQSPASSPSSGGSTTTRSTTTTTKTTPAPAPAPPFGTPEYTEWYYNNPNGPGYVANNPNTVEVDKDTGSVSVVDTRTGDRTVTGVVTKPAPKTTEPSKTIPAYENIDGKYYYNPNNTAGLPNANNYPVNPGFKGEATKPTGTLSKSSTLQDREESQAALDKLYSYGQGDPDDLSNPDPVSYDIVRYLRDNPDDTETLKKAGFSDEDIRKAKEESEKPLSQEEFNDNYLKKKFGKTYDEIMSRKQKSGENNDDYYKRIAENDRMLREATNAYVAKYGAGALALTGAARVGELFIAPPLRALRPEVAMSDITKTEWILTGVMAVTTLIPGARAVNSDLLYLPNSGDYTGD